MSPLRVLGATPLDGFRLALEFSDETRGVAALSSIIPGMQDEEAFQGVFVEPNGVSWPGGVSLSARTLYTLVYGCTCSTVADLGCTDEYLTNRRTLDKLRAV